MFTYELFEWASWPSEGTNIQSFPQYKTGWVYSPASFFKRRKEQLRRRYRRSEVMRLDMFIELFAKLFNSFATRDAGKWFPATRPIRAPRKATQPGGVFDKCFCKLWTVSSLFNLEPHGNGLIVDEKDWLK